MQLLEDLGYRWIPCEANRIEDGGEEERGEWVKVGECDEDEGKGFAAARGDLSGPPTPDPKRAQLPVLRGRGRAKGATHRGSPGVRPQSRCADCVPLT